MANYCDCTISMDSKPEDRDEVRELLGRFTRLHGDNKDISVTHFSEIVGESLDRDWGWGSKAKWDRAVWTGALKWDPPLDFAQWLSTKYPSALISVRYYREFGDHIHEIDFVNGSQTYARVGPFKECADDSPLIHHRWVFFGDDSRGIEKLIYDAGVAVPLDGFPATRMRTEDLLEWIRRRKDQEVQVRGVIGHMVDEEVVLRELLEERLRGNSIDSLAFLPSLHLSRSKRLAHPAFFFFPEQIEREIELSPEEMKVVASLLCNQVISLSGSFKPHLFSRFEILRNVLGRPKVFFSDLSQRLWGPTTSQRVCSPSSRYPSIGPPPMPTTLARLPISAAHPTRRGNGRPSVGASTST